MQLNRLDTARFPAEPGEAFTARVLAAARREPRPVARPSLLPELLDGIGWAAAVWVCGMFARQFLL